MFKTYFIFAMVATGINLFTQYISFRIHDGFYSLYIAMAFGTLAGLLLKYILDKKFIFKTNIQKKSDHFRTFFFYSCTGALTTVPFWGIEILFSIIWEGEYAKFIGATLGLAIGYSLKFMLDIKYVFKSKTYEIK